MTQTNDEIHADIAAARSTATEATNWRTETRWRVRKDDPDRQAHCQYLLDAIDDAMKPIRSHIGRAVHVPPPAKVGRDLSAVSAALQYERRQLKKMLR